MNATCFPPSSVTYLNAKNEQPSQAARFFMCSIFSLTSEQVGVSNYTDGGAEPGIAQVGRVSVALHVDL